MPLVKLPDGQIVNSALVESVTTREAFGSYYVDINLNGGKTVSVECSGAGVNLAEMMRRIADGLGVVREI